MRLTLIVKKEEQTERGIITTYKSEQIEFEIEDGQRVVLLADDFKLCEFPTFILNRLY